MAINSVLPRPFLQGAGPCPFLMTPCPLDTFFFKMSVTHSVYSRIWKLPVIFFGHCPCTVHSTCQAEPRGWCRSAYSIFYWQNDTAIVISLQHANNCIKNTILSLFYIQLVVYYNKRSRKSRGIAELKQNPWNPFFFYVSPSRWWADGWLG